MLPSNALDDLPIPVEFVDASVPNAVVTLSTDLLGVDPPSGNIDAPPVLCMVWLTSSVCWPSELGLLCGALLESCCCITFAWVAVVVLSGCCGEVPLLVNDPELELAWLRAWTER